MNDVNDTPISCEDLLNAFRPLFRDSVAALRLRIDASEYSRLFFCVYNACSPKPPANHSDTLYRVIIQEFAVAAAASISDLELDAISPAWQEFVLRIRFVEQVCKYLDRFFVKWQSLPCIREVGTSTFVRAVGCSRGH